MGSVSRLRLRSSALPLVVLLALSVVLDVPAWAVVAKTRRVSVSSAGAEANGSSTTPSISADGRFIAFQSDASNLVGGDTNGHTDIFIRDRKLGKTRRVSVSSADIEGNADSTYPSISADGRFVAFQSSASNLIGTDTNAHADIFVRDRRTGTTRRVSVSSAGVEGNADSHLASISASGRFVAFDSGASNLVGGDLNAVSDVFVRDREAGKTKRVSVSSAGIQGNGGSDHPSISADGRLVAFDSGASNLVGSDLNAAYDVFVRDRETGKTKRVSVSTEGTEGDAGSYWPAISADGRFVTFYADASNLVGADNNGYPDVFVSNRESGRTSRASVSSAGTEGNEGSYDPWISGDGRFVGFSSDATNMVGLDTNGVSDVFVLDRTTGKMRRVSVDSAGTEGNGNSYAPKISTDGRFVAFESSASNLVGGDTNAFSDVFVRALS
jgi:Tol biopolymer transport system component